MAYGCASLYVPLLLALGFADADHDPLHLFVGIPHVAREDGMYEGYFIPKGAAIVPNLW